MSTSKAEVIRIGDLHWPAIRKWHGAGLRPAGECPRGNRAAIIKWRQGPKVPCWTENLECRGFRLSVTVIKHRNPQIFKAGAVLDGIVNPGKVVEISQFDRARFENVGWLNVLLEADEILEPDDGPLTLDERRDVISILDVLHGRKSCEYMAVDEAAAPSIYDAANDEDCIFRRMGENWQIRYDGRDLPLVRHRKGMIYIRELLSRPLDQITAAELSAIANPPSPDVLDIPRADEGASIEEARGNGGSRHEILDKATKDDLVLLKDEILSRREGAESGDKRAQYDDDLKEVDEWLRLKDVNAHRGGAVFESKADKNPRQAVSDAIQRAIQAIGDDKLMRFLTMAIKKGAKCVYTGGQEWIT